MLNKKLKEKFEIFDKIDKISSNENTKQSLFKNTIDTSQYGPAESA